MKLLIISIVLTITLFTGFVIGILSQATALTLAAFCASPFSLIFLGFAIGISRPHLVFGDDYTSATMGSDSAASRLSSNGQVQPNTITRRIKS